MKSRNQYVNKTSHLEINYHLKETRRTQWQWYDYKLQNELYLEAQFIEQAKGM